MAGAKAAKLPIKKRTIRPMYATFTTLQQTALQLPESVASLLRGAPVDQGCRRVVVALLAREKLLEADKAVVILKWNKMLLAWRQRVVALEYADHVAHRIRRREQRDRRKGRGDDAGRFEIRQASRLRARRL